MFSIFYNNVRKRPNVMNEVNEMRLEQLTL